MPNRRINGKLLTELGKYKTGVTPKSQLRRKLLMSSLVKLIGLIIQSKPEYA
jgi:hypothetical protein